MTDDTPSFESASVAAVLAQRSRDDRRALLDELVVMLVGGRAGRQSRTRTAAPARHSRSACRSADSFTTERRADDSFEASRQQEVRGVVIRTRSDGDRRLSRELGLALDVELRRTERGRDALREWLNSTLACHRLLSRTTSPREFQCRITCRVPPRICRAAPRNVCERCAGRATVPRFSPVI